MISTYGHASAGMWEVSMEIPGGDLARANPESLWLASAGETDYPALDRDHGGGRGGHRSRYRRADGRAGAQTGRATVAVIEAARVGTGVTGHTTGKVTSLHRLAYTELARNHGTGDRARLRPGQPGGDRPHPAGGG